MSINSVLRPAFLFAVILIAVYPMAVNGQSTQKPLEISHLTGDFYIYTTYSDYNGKPFPANSMYVVTTEGVILIDTPWDPGQFQPLLDSIMKRHRKKVVLCIATHFHADRTAGLEFFSKQGIKTFTSKHTHRLSIQRKEKLAEYHFSNDTSLVIGDHTFSTYYPGEGHSPDNIVIWFEKERVLYGGCFVKSSENASIGNIADANISAWPKAIINTQKKFPSTRYVIPGHMSWQNNDALNHTLSLIRSHTK